MTIKTLVEVRGGRVSIVENGNETQVTITRDEQEEMAAANVLDQAERAGKVPALERRIAELEADRSGSHGRIEGLEDRVRDLESERDALLLKVQGYDNDRHTEKQRADENQGRLTTSRTLLESAQQDLNDAKASLTRIQDKVWKDTLDLAMTHRGAPEEIPVETVGDLANAVSAVRSIVGQP
jgi:chromosome segregation ATPase